MRRKRKSVGVIAFLVFVAVILVSGYALNAAGYDNNPFDQIVFLSGSLSGGEARFGRDLAAGNGNADFALTASDADNNSVDLTGLSTTDSFQLPPVSELSGSDTNAVPSTGSDTFAGIGQGDENSIAWSDIGDVLYNLWFICATTAVFIVIQRVFKFSIQQLKSRRLPVMAAAK